MKEADRVNDAERRLRGDYLTEITISIVVEANDATTIDAKELKRAMTRAARVASASLECEDVIKKVRYSPKVRAVAVSPKVHLRVSEPVYTIGAEVPGTLCGHFAKARNITEDQARVTCALCRKKVGGTR